MENCMEWLAGLDRCAKQAPLDPRSRAGGMQTRLADRRAAPPRPTLLVGDMAACHAAFVRLQQRVLELSMQQRAALADRDSGERSAAPADAWRDLVPRCRALRETLTSLRELSHFTREVYECAADVCAWAGDYPEALKALQMLVHSIYPALAAAEAAAGAEGAAGEGAAAGGGAGGQTAGAGSGPAAGAGSATRATAGEQALPWRSQAAARRAAEAEASSATSGEELDDDGPWLGAHGMPALEDSQIAAALEQPQFRRWPEAAGALALYFTACVQQQQGDAQLDTVATLRRLPRPLLASRDVGAALRLRAALAAGDFVSFFRLRAEAPSLVRAVADGAAGRVRERALAALAAAYRNIALQAVCRMLALDAPRQLLASLKLLADRGHAAAQRALGALQQEDAAALAAADLVFKG